MRHSGREEKRRKRSKMVLGIITIVIMVGSGLGIFANNMGNNEGEIPYGDFVFMNVQGLWDVEIDGKIMSFMSHPLEIEHINMSPDMEALIASANAIILTNDPTSLYAQIIAGAQYDLATKLYESKGIIVINGFSAETETEVPLITCDNSTEQQPVIFFESGQSTELVQEGSCIHAYAGTDSDFFRLSDRILFSYLGIIK